MEEFKAQGNALFLEGKPADALVMYGRGIRAGVRTTRLIDVLVCIARKQLQSGAFEDAAQFSGAANFLAGICQEDASEDAERQRADARQTLSDCLAAATGSQFRTAVAPQLRTTAQPADSNWWCLHVVDHATNDDLVGVTRTFTSCNLLHDLLVKCANCSIQLNKNTDAIQYVTVILDFFNPLDQKAWACRRKGIERLCNKNDWLGEVTQEEAEARACESEMWGAVKNVQMAKANNSPAQQLRLGLVQVPDMLDCLKIRWPAAALKATTSFIQGVCELASGMRCEEVGLRSCNVQQRMAPFRHFPEAVLRYLHEPAPCIIHDRPPVGYATIHHPHANSPAQKMEYTKRSSGTPNRHLSIGFCDLGQLLEIDDDTSGVAFLLVDLCHLAVAKSLVILAMMRDPRTEDASILEVWFSATWTIGTGRDFLRACNAVARQPVGPNHTLITRNSDVERVIATWCKAFEVPLQVGRNACQRAVTNYMYQGCEAMNFTSTEYAADALTYFLTRDVHGRLSGPIQSNTTFFGSPEDSPNELKASFFHTFTLEQFVEAVSTPSPNMAVPPSLVDNPLWSTGALVRKLGLYRMKAIAACRQRIQAGEIMGVSFCCAEVSLEDERLQRELRAFAPTIVSWCNCVDYIHSTDLHPLAERIAPSAKHFGYSMNWIRRVKGSVLSDYPPERQASLVQESEVFMQQSLMRGGAGDLFRHPPLLFVMNYGTLVCRQECFDVWLNDTMCGRRVVSSKVPNFFPLARFTGVMEFSWLPKP